MITFVLKKIKILLSDKRVSFFVLLFAILSKIIQLIFFYNIRVDGSFQYMAMQSFVRGHGISIAYVLPHDLSATLYRPLVEWPPGYSLLLAPFYLVFQPNYIAAGLALEICAAILLIFTSRSILKFFDTPVYLLNIFTLIQGFFIYYFYFIDSSDEIAIPFFLLAVYQTLLFLKVRQKLFLRMAAVAICLLVCASIKYLFVPVAFILPVYLIAKGFFPKERKIITAGIVSFSILTIGIGCLIIWEKTINGAAGYISQNERGFFPQHLLDAYPFVPAAFINPDTINIFIHERSKQVILLYIYQIVHLLLILIAAKYILVSFFKELREKSSIRENYLHILFFVSLGLTMLLAALSLCVAKEEIMPGTFWTYIEEPRYYGLIAVMIQLTVFIFYSNRFHFRGKKYFLGILVLFLLPEFFRGLIFDTNRIRHFGKEEYSWQYEDRFQKYADSVLKKEQKRFPSEKMAITGSSYYMNHRISLYSHVPILQTVQNINQLSTIHTKKPVLLMVVLNEKELSSFASFLSSHKEVAGKWNEFYFYTVYVQPN